MNLSQLKEKSLLNNIGVKFKSEAIDMFDMYHLLKHDLNNYC